MLDSLPRYLDKDGVVAVGEIGYDSMTPEEDEAFAAPAGAGRRGTTCRCWCTPRTGTSCRARCAPWTWCASPASRRTGSWSTTSTRRPCALVADSGCWMGFSIYPDTKMDEARMVALLARVRHRAGAGELRRRLGPLGPAEDPVDRLTRCSQPGSTSADVDTVLWRNPVEFYGQSGRLLLDPVDGDRRGRRRATGNSVLRGER